MQFEPVKTQYQPKTAAEVIATARLVRQRRINRDADVIARQRAEAEAQLKAKREAEATRKAQEDELKRLAHEERVRIARIAAHLAYHKARQGLDAIDAVIVETAFHFAVSKDEITSESRARGLIYPRHLAMYIAKKLTKRSFHDIGMPFSNRDNSTVQYAVGKIEALLEAGDERAASDIAAIKQALGVA
jgi:chromosomal replication initiation ATPase DnaA